MRFARYFVVGTIAFAVDLALLMALAPHLPLLAANTIAFAVANVVNFILAHVWVFRRPFRARELPRQYVSVLGVSVVGLALNDALVWLGVAVAGAPIVVAKVIATLVTLVWNYFARSLWIYREKRA